jgi:transketolase
VPNKESRPSPALQAEAALAPEMWVIERAVEAAVRLGWDRYIGEDGGFVGMSGFGASGAETDLYEHFGITPGKVVEEVRKRLKSRSP